MANHDGSQETPKPIGQPAPKEQQPPAKPAATVEAAERQHIQSKAVTISIIGSNKITAGEPLRFEITNPQEIHHHSRDLGFIEEHLCVVNQDDDEDKLPADVHLSVVGDKVTGELETAGLEEGTIYILKGANPLNVNNNRGAAFMVEKPADRPSETNVTLQRTGTHPTKDQALWVAIRNSTNAISFDRYQQFIELVFNGNTYSSHTLTLDRAGKGSYGNSDRLLPNLNIYGPYSYTILKLATQAFLTLQCGLTPPFGQDLEGLPIQSSGELETFLNQDRLKLIDPDDEEIRLGGHVTHHKLKKKLEHYLGDNKVLPYLDRIVGALLTVGPGEHHNHSGEPRIKERLPYYYGILQHRATRPSLIELIWSYWLEEGMLAQTMNAIALRFQNQRSGPNDPLAELELAPLHPLSNMIWGFVQDKYNQLSVARRASEYGHQYGLKLVGRAVPELQLADSRSKFIEVFHNLLYRTAVFYREDSDTTVHADAFPLLNALKDVHLLLAEGAHNQYGDLPWTARTEMLSQQWMLARPEMREFLRGRHMVPYQEKWMGAVDAMKKLQGWTDTTISHFQELAVDGERVLLSIRFGNWSDLNLTEYNAKNWARYWKPEIQRYLYGYMAVTGVDLMNEMTDTRDAEIRYIQPSALLQRRLMSQTRQPAALAAAPRRQAIAAPLAGLALPRSQQTSRVSRMRAIKYEQGE